LLLLCWCWNCALGAVVDVVVSRKILVGLSYLDSGAICVVFGAVVT
jgi:hypothetical protein